MNDELLKRLAEKRGSVRPVVPRTADTSAPLNYHSPPAEVEAWLVNKGFSPELSEHCWRKPSFDQDFFKVKLIGLHLRIFLFTVYA